MSFNPIDVYVGGRVKTKRKSMKLTQQDLAKALGLTFQQVQKYERGANRISASKLHMISQTLKEPIAYFFDGIESGNGQVPGFSEDPASYGGDAIKEVLNFASSDEGLELNQAFGDIKDPKVRRYLVGLFQAIADAED